MLNPRIEQLSARQKIAGIMAAGNAIDERLGIRGRFHALFNEYKGGPRLAEYDFDNVVATIGKNALFNAGLVTSAVTLVGPFLGLISSVSYSAPQATDTMASHSEWLEADSTNAPAYTVSSAANRASVVFGTPSAGATAITAVVFTFTGSGTVEGCFVLFGTGAVNTWQNSSGTLLSAGAFGTAQPVISGNTLTVSYSISM